MERVDQRVANGLATRRRILERAVEVASLEGLEGLSVGRLALDLKISKAGVFAHFGSKEQLQLATLEAARAIFEQRMLTPASEDGPGLVRLMATCERWFDYVDSGAFPGGCFFAAAAAELDGRPGLVRDRLVALTERWRGRLEALVREAVREGHLRKGTDVEQLVFELYALELGANWARQLFDDKLATSRARATLVQRLRALATSTGTALIIGDGSPRAAAKTTRTPARRGRSQSRRAAALEKSSRSTRSKH